MFARKMLLIFFGKRTILAGLDVAKEFFQSETSEVPLGSCKSHGESNDSFFNSHHRSFGKGAVRYRAVSLTKLSGSMKQSRQKSSSKN